MKDQTATSIFQDQWDAYQWLIDHNAMGHSELITTGKTLLDEFLCDNPVQMTDLGCGNSLLIPDLTCDIDLEAYCGVDLAGNALARSKAILSPLGLRLQHIQHNLFNGLPAKAMQANLIYSAFAVHHGKREEKQHLLNALHRQSVPGCFFLLIDVFCYPDQTRAEFSHMLREHFIDLNCRQDWLEHIMDHINHYDYAETESDWLCIVENSPWSVRYKRSFYVSERYPVMLLFLQH